MQGSGYKAFQIETITIHHITLTTNDETVKVKIWIPFFCIQYFL